MPPSAACEPLIGHLAAPPVSPGDRARLLVLLERGCDDRQRWACDHALLMFLRGTAGVPVDLERSLEVQARLGARDWAPLGAEPRQVPGAATGLWEGERA